MASTTIPTVSLHHGASMPALGLGTYPMDDAETAAVVERAVEHGYRLFDTAEKYENERGVGQGVRAAGIDRADVFITSKFDKQWHSVDGARQAFEASIERIGTDYLDLLLIHWPNPQQDGYVDAFRGLLSLLEEGRLRAIGTSNFKPAHLTRLLDETGEAPDLNQIELSPYTTRAQSRAYAALHGIVTQSWSPLARAGDLFGEPAVTQAAVRHGRTPAQVVLRWHLQLGLTVIPKTSNDERLRENAAVFDFELDDDEVAAITDLDRGEAEATDSDTFGH